MNFKVVGGQKQHKYCLPYSIYSAASNQIKGIITNGILFVNWFLSPTVIASKAIAAAWQSRT